MTETLQPLAHRPLHIAPCGAAEYPEALLRAGAEAGIVTPLALQRFSASLAELLAGQTKRYTMDESSSIPYDEAQGLLQSLLYGMGFGLKGQGSQADALAALLHTPPKTLLEEGRNRLATAVKRAHRLWLAAKAGRTATPSYHYNAVLKGIAPFFKFYDIRYAAQETPCDIDYPLAHAPWELTGVEYIMAYLENLLHENRFLAQFAPQTVHKTLLRANPLYADLPFSLFEPVLMCAIGCRLCGQSVHSLRASAGQYAPMAAKFEALPPSRLAPLLYAEALRTAHTLQLGAGATAQYMARAAQNHAPQLLAALTAGNLAAFFYAENLH